MTDPGNDPQVDGALQTFRDVLAGDGYLLSWSRETATDLVMRVEAGPDACAECLVPEPVMRAILSDALAGTPYAVTRVELPAGAE